MQHEMKPRALVVSNQTIDLMVKHTAVTEGIFAEGIVLQDFPKALGQANREFGLDPVNVCRVHRLPPKSSSCGALIMS
jgi:hypothetical protein